MCILFTLVAVLLADQISKQIIAKLMVPGESIPMLGSFFQLTYVRNPRAAFGVSLGAGPFHIVVSSIVIVLLTVLLWKMRQQRGGVPIALSCILAGAWGNLIDRIRWGEVIDFLNLGIGNYRWPVFNLADLAVTAGAFFLVFLSIRKGNLLKWNESKQ
ncbi:MAG: signal peptidase II [Candidatus Latescibacteria bacterium 4484_181]|nr:MAG: signal peptidase II [Candidatus Latescibacteria bacterium 4484_181]RKY67969.1 MAG: signal peptidase II [Candidatus Latescibacterota bacterium]RKY69371.1 MAG: signal peptidase II [Candidatus Latescibacterota bacterium]